MRGRGFSDQLNSLSPDEGDIVALLDYLDPATEAKDDRWKGFVQPMPPH